MPDLFGSRAPKINGHRYDLFNGREIDTFSWIVALFSQGGATRAIIKANAVNLATFYPIKFNKQGDPVPLWSNYLFIEYREFISIELCRKTPNFIRIISSRDPYSDIMHPIMVRRHAIQESLRLMTEGKFNEQVFVRPFHGRGSIVRVLDGPFLDKQVRLEIDVPSGMNGKLKVPVDINGIKATIELFKLAL
jgi:transcription antitermination factor NusG